MPLQKISKLVRGFASKVLAIDDTAQPEEHIKLIKELLGNHSFDCNGNSITDIILMLRRKHLVDSIIVTKRDGSVLASTEQNGLKAAITGTALFNYVSSELVKAETVLVKSDNDWFMVFPFNEKIFMVKASASLSVTELKCLAKELDSFLKTAVLQHNDKAF